MKQRTKHVAACVAIVLFGITADVFADFPNIFHFTQTQNAVSTPGKLILTYSPGLTETVTTTPYLAGADVNWINCRTGQQCATAAMQRTQANTFTCAIDIMPGDTILYFFAQRWIGNQQAFYGWIPMHQCTNETDTKWFSYIAGIGFEQKPAWPLVTDGSDRFRGRHEDEWRFDGYNGNYFNGTALDYKIVDWGDSVMIVLFPAEPTNWGNGRFFGMSGFDTLCDHDTYTDNRGSGDMPQYPNGILGPVTVPIFGVTENPYQKYWDVSVHPLKWYVWTIRGLSYGQYIDFEFSAAPILRTTSLNFCQPLRYYVGSGKMGQKFQHPWANACAGASVSTVTFPEFGFSSMIQNAGPGTSWLFMKGKALFDDDLKTNLVYTYPQAFDCIGAKMSFPDTTRNPTIFTGREIVGPVYKSSSCFACHFQNGKGYPENMLGSDPAITTLSLCKLQVAGPNGSVAPHPVFGPALQTKGTAPAQPQGKLKVTWEEIPGVYADGTAFSLRKPYYSFDSLGWGVSAVNLDSVRISPRYIPHLAGLGLLEAVDENTILSFVNLSGKDGTGIMGKPQRVNDKFKGQNALGRFGWKSGYASLKGEIAASLAMDLGVSNEYFANQGYLGGLPDASEISSSLIDTLVAYVSLLAPPPRQMGLGYITYDPKIASATAGGAIWLDPSLYNGEAFEKIWRDPSAIRGKALFTQAKCHLCHIPALRTGSATPFAELKGIEIQPFTDLLLHNMGSENGDNGYIEGIAGPADWRTAPLWGLGYVKYSNKISLMMHDGRARSVEEAILWHFGEGLVSRNSFLQMSASQRADLSRFCEYPFWDQGIQTLNIVSTAQFSNSRIVQNGLIKIECSPNPVRTVATIRLINIPLAKTDKITMSIFDLTGRKVFVKKIMAGQTSLVWNARSYAAGRYVVQLSVNGRSFTRNLLVIR
jgi:CxxC motif-containing protein (DUF1111 family)